MGATIGVMDRSALLVVDVQLDFCPGGALPVPDGDRVAAAISEHIGDAVACGLTVYASRDWHPPVTTHFAPDGGTWPVHCVQGTRGADFHPALRLPDTAIPSAQIAASRPKIAVYPRSSDCALADAARTPAGARFRFSRSTARM